MNKKGSHVGVVLSFIIFMSFILFFYIILPPAVVQEEREGFLDYLESRILEEITSEVTTASISISPSASSCVSLEFFFSTYDIGDKVLVVDSNGNSIDEDESEGDLEISQGSETFFKVYGSNDFSTPTDSLSGCELISFGNYEVGLLKTEDEAISSKIVNLSQRYIVNLQGLKSTLLIPPENNFGFNFTYQNGTSIVVGYEVIEGIGVYLKSMNLQYIKEDGSKEIGTLEIRTW